ncbi:MAG: type VII toxin-antitoxin system MntA family adenylyltransferase antitoxin [Candidatus Aminicenantaceae bacterium]
MIKILQQYFSERKDIAFAFLFGSGARAHMRKESDMDIAVYFKPEQDLEWEEFEKTYESENRIALDLERLLKKEVDLIVLNRAKALLADEILRKGHPIVIKDRGIFLEYFCIISDEAEDMRNWLDFYYKETGIEQNR